MLDAKTITIEVPSMNNDDWVTLTFYTNNVLAPNHEPIKIERSSRFPVAAYYQEYAMSTLAKLRFVFYKNKCTQQLQLKTFSHKKDSVKPNENAFNLALLMADLHFSGEIILPEMSAVESGFCFNRGLLTLKPCDVAPTNQQQGDLNTNSNINAKINHRNCLVFRYGNTSLTPYQAIFDYNLLEKINAMVPQNIKQSRVYFPMVDSGQNSGHTLTSFSVLYIPSSTQSISIIGNDVTFKFSVNEFIEQNIDVNMILTGHVLIDCGSRPSKGHNSWQLSLVTALQIATGLMPCSDTPLICTGQVTKNDIDDNSRGIVPIGEAVSKYNFIQKLNQENKKLLTAFNHSCDDENWYFCLPEKNYYELDINESSMLQVLPVTYWYFEDLIS